MTVKIRELHDHAARLGVDFEVLPGVGRMRRQRDDLVPRHGRDGRDRGAIMRMQISRQHRLAALGDPVRHQHRLGRRGRAVIHRGIGHFHAGQHGDLSLKLEQCLQRALGDLGLIGRIGSKELGALNQVVDARRNVMPIGAAADEERHGSGRHVASRHLRKRPLDFELALAGRQIRRAQCCGRNVGEQIIDVAHADAGEHLGAILGSERKIAHQ